MRTAYLSLGSNLGDRAVHLRTAVDALAGPHIHIVALSPIYETEHVGDTANVVPDYLNCVARVDTDLPPHELLHYTQAVERSLGRIPGARFAPRTVDIDILLVGDAVLDGDDLTLPHPRMADRAFVLTPLDDVAPGLALPDGRRVDQILGTPAIQAQRIARLDVDGWLDARSAVPTR